MSKSKTLYKNRTNIMMKDVPVLCELNAQIYFRGNEAKEDQKTVMQTKE